MEGKNVRQASDHVADLKYLAQGMWKDFKKETGKITLEGCYWRGRESSPSYFFQKCGLAGTKQCLVEVGHSLGLQWERGCHGGLLSCLP